MFLANYAPKTRSAAAAIALLTALQLRVPIVQKPNQRSQRHHCEQQ